MKAYTYHTKSTGYSSQRYGACEVCGDHCSEVFLQTEMWEYESGHFTHHGCKNTLFGHEACLQNARRTGWNNASIEERILLAKECGWITRNNALTKTGSRIANSKWEGLSVAAQRVITQKVAA